MARAEAAHGAHHGFGRHLVDDLGEEHNQGSLAQALRKVTVGHLEIRLDDLGVDVVRSGHHPLRRPTATLRRQKSADPSVEGKQADLIPGPRRHVRKHQHGIERVIELRQSLGFRGHQSTAIEHAQHRLIALLLVLARDELLTARGRLPVDGAIVVVALVVAQGFEFILATAQAHGAHHPVFQALPRQHFVGAYGLHVGIHTHRVAGGDADLAPPQPERRGPAQVVIAKFVEAATGGFHMVSDQGMPGFRHLHGLGQTLDRQSVGRVIVHLHGQRLLRGGINVQPDQVWPPYRENARRLAFDPEEYAPPEPCINRREKRDG